MSGANPKRSEESLSIPLQGKRQLTLDAAHETVTVLGPEGTVLLRLRVGPDGVQLELGQPDLSVSVPGKLVLEGESVSVRARRGDVHLQANDDVRLVGERIRLN